MTIRKVFVDGAFNSGKTEFIRHLSELDWITTEIKLDDDEGYLACDFGRLTFDEDDLLYIFGAPGARRIDPFWSFFDDMIGIVLIVDSSFTMSFREAQSRIDQWLYRDIPMIVVANKQDKPTSFSPDDLRIALKIDDDIPVLPCYAKTGEGVSEIMIALCQEYLRRNLS